MARAPSAARARRFELLWENCDNTNAALHELDRMLRGQGWRRAGTVRATLRRGRILTLRFTWNQICGGIALKRSFTEQYVLGEGAANV